MARPKSVILTPQEKKAVVANLKEQIKGLKADLKNNAISLKAINKTFATAGKAHLTDTKANEKAVVGVNKALQAVEAQLVAMNTPAT